ncbi:unnamed protein product [Mesocestoides corti]|uniref:Protein shisa-5 n=1 Tax=Mesocestoides corti TaxID=53468 RepID=A0A0R3UJ75_MESCO|nr:unnamed protein product [Mesocestoides corti]
MSRSREVVGDWVGAHIICCKVASSCLLFIAVGFIIAGAVLVSSNSGSWDFDKEDFDDFSERQSRFSAGIALIVFGVFMLICGLVFLCCVFQLKFVRKAVKSTNSQQQPTPYPPAAGQQVTQPYPVQPYPSQQGPGQQMPQPYPTQPYQPSPLAPPPPYTESEVAPTAPLNEKQ